MPDIRKKTIKGLKVGDTFTVSRQFTEQDVTQFANMTRNRNPLYFDEQFTAMKNLRGRICPGLLVASLITEIGGQMGWLASGMNFRFKKPVYFGETITCSFTITAIDEKGRAKAGAIYKNQDGIIVLESFLTGIIPSLPERMFMREMANE